MAYVAHGMATRWCFEATHTALHCPRQVGENAAHTHISHLWLLEERTLLLVAPQLYQWEWETFGVLCNVYCSEGRVLPHT